MHFQSLYKYCPACGSSSFENQSEKSKKCRQCGFVFYMNTAAAVATFIFNEKGELLVCRRGKEPAKGTLDLPGGFVDGNENAEEALARELKEELGADLIETKYLFSLPNEYEYSGLTIPTLDLFFETQLVSTSDLKAADDVEEAFFVPLKDVNPDLFGLKSIKKAVALFLKNAQ